MAERSHSGQMADIFSSALGPPGESFLMDATELSPAQVAALRSASREICSIWQQLTLLAGAGAHRSAFGARPCAVQTSGCPRGWPARRHCSGQAPAQTRTPRTRAPGASWSPGGARVPQGGRALSAGACRLVSPHGTPTNSSKSLHAQPRASAP